MSTKCVFLLAVVQLLVATMTAAPTNTVRCEERLDIIDPSQWPALPIRYFGRDLLSEAKLAAVGHAHGTHSILHTASRDSFLRGSSAMFHLYGDDVTRELVELRGVGLKEIHFGGTFIAILTEGGLIYTVGSNSNGQLAHHGLENRKVFSLVEGLPPVTMMAAGTSFAVAMSHNGTLYSWGYSGNEGRLGYPTETELNPVAKRISLGPEHVQVKFLCCGWHQCAVLTDHSVFTWGDHRRIGRPTGDYSPGRVHGIPDGVNIIKITCGAWHTLALSDSGRLFGWGNNDHGELLSVTNQAPSATELELDGRIVRDVVAGNRVTIIRTYSPVAEYFGRFDGRNVNTLQAANYTARDVMARTKNGQRSWGAVELRC